MIYNHFSKLKVVVFGLGYVGLPLAMAFSDHFKTIGFDIDIERLRQLRSGIDRTGEVDKEQLKTASNLEFTNKLSDIADCNFYIVTVPTPVDQWNRPDLSPLRNASVDIAKVISAGDVVVFESTVFPGATEDICGVIIATNSGLKLAKSDDDDPSISFYLGYSPERINPGDKTRRLTDIVKVTSGSSPAAAVFIDEIYSKVVAAGTYKAASMQVAEAAKVIENTQRDVNIALINELAILFDRLDIDTEQVLQAAGTKWNFLPFKPGLVGGHCIGIDPYYLTQKAVEVDYHPEMILAGRRINEGMGEYIAKRVLRLMLENQINPLDSRVLIMGLTFKENCPDLRNSKVFHVMSALAQFKCIIDVYDPIMDDEVLDRSDEFKVLKKPIQGVYDAIVLAVSHSVFIRLGVAGIRKFGKDRHVLFDVKSTFESNEVDGRL